MNTNLWLAIVVLAVVMGAMFVLKPSDTAMSAAERSRGTKPRIQVVWSHDSQGWQLPVISADH